MADMGTVKTAFKNIATIFVASPLQEEVNDSSFIMETPSIHYLPTYKVKKGPKTLVKQEIIQQPVEPNEELDVDSTERESVRQESAEVESVEQSSPAKSHYKTEDEDIIERKQDHGPLVEDIDILPNLDFAENSYTPLTMDLDLYDFSKDFTVSDELSLGGSSYHNALMTLPLRDRITDSFKPESPDASEEDVISIPRPLETFPDILVDVPLYRDLFHHFIHVTANVLVPAPNFYPQNPFRTLLPAMALSTPHLLDLILAYAAAHRARFLHQETPVHVISRLLGRVFAGLTKSLENQKEAQSDTTLTTAIMLSSYEILTGAGDTSWKKHLHGARDIVVARGMLTPFLQRERSIHDMIQEFTAEDVEGPQVLGPQSLGLLRSSTKEETDVSYFLIRWFAYIDVIGALSSAKATALVSTNENMAQLWALHDWSIARLKERGIEEILGSGGVFVADRLPVKIDFLLGMDLDMLPVFSKVTHLARQRRLVHEKYDANRILELHPDEVEARNRAIQEIASEALELADLIISFCDACELRRKQYVNNAIAEELAKRTRRGSNGSVRSNQSSDDPSSGPTITIEQLSNQVQTYSQLCVMNTTFCYAVLIQLYRRVLHLETHHELVQNVVCHITELLDMHIPQGSPVESCMSFPIFTTACEVLDPIVREKFWLRMTKMERFGVGPIQKARATMELSWQRNVPWVDILEENNWEIVFA